MPSAAPKKDQKKAAPAAAKSSSPKTPAAAALSAEAGSAPTDDVPRLAGGRPDQAAFNAQQDALKKEIDTVQTQLVRIMRLVDFWERVLSEYTRIECGQG